MSTWITMAVDDLYPICGKTIVDRMLEALGADADETFDAIQRQVASGIRGKVAACKSVTLSAVRTEIPPEFITLAGLRILILINGRTSKAGGGEATFELTEDQRSLLRSLERDLDAAAKCDFGITNPVDEVFELTQPDPLSSPRVRNFLGSVDYHPQPIGPAFDEEFSEGFS